MLLIHLNYIKCDLLCCGEPIKKKKNRFRCFFNTIGRIKNDINS